MASVKVYVLKRDRMALLSDLTDILKEEDDIILSSSCSQKLRARLEEELQPAFIPYDRNDPDRATNMNASTRIQKAKAYLETQTTISKHTSNSYLPPNTDTSSRFGGPRNINQSFIAGDNFSLAEDEEPQACVERPTHKSRSHSQPSMNTHDGFSGPRPKYLSPHIASSGNIPVAVKPPKNKNLDPHVTFQIPLKKKSFEHPPEDVTSSFYLPHTNRTFGTLYPHVDLSEYSKPPGIQEGAATHNEDKPARRGSASIKDDHQRSRHEVSAGNESSQPELNDDSLSIPIIKLTKALEEATQDSSGSSQSHNLQSSAEGTQGFQGTPDSTYFSQSQGFLSQSQVPTIKQNIDPKDLLRPPPARPLKRLVPKAPMPPQQPVEVKPRRSARLAEKAAPAPAPPALTPSSAPKPNVKRGRESDAEDSNEDEREGRNKKVVTETTVEKQRETRRTETTKRGGRGRGRGRGRRGA